MAESEVQHSTQPVKEVDDLSKGPAPDVAEETTAKAATATPSTSKPASPALPSPSPAPAPTRPSSGAMSAPTLSMPAPKKFSHVDINKRFLEKNSAATSTSHTPSISNTVKTGPVTQKPQLQTTPSHSKLVAAKLTADTQRSSTTGPGWSRPPSTSSSLGPTPAPATNPKPTPVSTPSAGHHVLQPAPGVKVIQPQPRALVDSPASMTRKDSTGKAAWSNPKASVSVVGNLDSVQNEFPTAAEVAQGKSAKTVEKKQAAQAALDHKQALAADADAFRGVHLGPNVHHWDEDEGDDNNFLDDVIEFDDGRQYTVPQVKDEAEAGTSNGAIDGAAAKKSAPGPDRPVSKEERFADDFDRSWPRSRSNGIPHDRGQPPLLSPSATSSQSLHSPQESSRVLFNERSNRLEPYSSHAPNRQGGPPRDSYFARRNSRSDVAPSPTELRNHRDAPPHTHGGVQLLQKPGHNGHVPPVEDGSLRRSFGEHSGFGSPHESRFRDRDMGKRDGFPPRNHGYEHNHSRDMQPPPGPPDRSRRMSQMGPPPIPGSPEVTRDGRQLPPHLAGASSQPDMWRTTSRTSDSGRQRRLSTASSVGHSSVHGTPHPAPAQSPVVPHVAMSPVVPEPPLEAVAEANGVDIDEVRKAAMHSAAERARLRRQQEEEEREREKERARRKAAELEARIKAAEEEKAKAKAEAEAEKEAQVNAVLEDAARVAAEKTKQPSTSHPERSPVAPSPRVSFGRAPSARGGIRPGVEKRTSVVETSPATEAETWRSKAAPAPPPQRTPEKPSVAAVPMMPHVDSFSITVDDSVEVIDFTEHGKLAGKDATTEEPVHMEDKPRPPPIRPPRPSASDYFQDSEEANKPSSTHPKGEESSWRRRTSFTQDARTPTTAELRAREEVEGRSKIHVPPSPNGAQHGPEHFQRHFVHSDEDGRSQHEHPGHGHHQPLKSPLGSSFREAPMSALDDTMARIKGALDGMHKVEPKQKWIPPAMRPPTEHEHTPLPHHVRDEHVYHEEFAFTATEPPKPPPAAWHHFTVRLPRTSSTKEPVPFKQMRGFTSRNFSRSDIFSLQAPRQGKFRQDILVETLLFIQPPGQTRTTVLLPSNARAVEAPTFENGGPKVNLPSKARPPKALDTGAFGRPREADGVSSWRKPPASPLKQSQVAELPRALDTVSRSPPPEAPAVANGPTTPSVTSPTVSVPPTKAKGPAKVVQDAAVGFYRPGSTDISTNGAMKFIVSSELEDDSKSSSAIEKFTAPGEPAPSLTVTRPDTMVANVETSTSSTAASWPPPSDALSKENSVKALWTSTSNKIDVSSSKLIGTITNELETVPFVAPEAKSEESNPPHPSIPHRMSSQEVARSFQQVPNSPAGVNSNRSLALPMPNSPSNRPSMPPPMVPGGMRPPYPGYPSPMMGSPSPTMVYAQAMSPSPVPRPMVVNGPTPPQYGSPMWVPMQPNGPPPPMGMMRQMNSPYGPQLMPYPPGGAMPMYAPPPPNMQGASPQNRPPGMMMSPGPVQAQPAPHPMYATSPVLMHAVPGMPPPSSNPGYGGPPPPGQGRGPQSREMYNGMVPPQGYPGSQPPQPYPGLPPNSYARTQW